MGKTERGILPPPIFLMIKIKEIEYGFNQLQEDRRNGWNLLYK